MSTESLSNERKHPIPVLGAKKPDGAKCSACHDTGQFFDADGHGRFSWKRPCYYCRREVAAATTSSANDVAERVQWRIMWTHATGDEAGAQWRDEPPTPDELREWCEDFQPLALRVERRTIIESEPEYDRSFDVYLVDAHVAASSTNRKPEGA